MKTYTTTVAWIEIGVVDEDYHNRHERYSEYFDGDATLEPRLNPLLLYFFAMNFPI